MPARNHIDLTVKTMSVLESLVDTSEGRTLGDVAGRVRLIKSSVFRILFTLKELGYVEQVGEGGKYRLTFKTAGLVRRSVQHPALSRLAQPHLLRLRNRLNESAWLAEYRRHGIVLTDVVEASHALKLAFDVGDLCPVHATALGKAIGAWLDPDALEQLIPRGKLPRFTSRTLVRRSDLKTELQKVRQRGFALNAEESIEGAFIVGVPLFDSLGSVFAAVSVSAPTARCSPAKRREMIDEVLAAGEAITRDLRNLAFRAPRLRE